MPDPSSSGIVSSQPMLNLGGQDAPEVSGGLLELVIIETVQGLYRCEATLSNWGQVGSEVGFLYFDRRTLDFGKAFQIKVGDNTLFKGRITALEAGFPEGRPPEITILAEDRLQDLRMTRRTRTFESKSDSDVFSQIASDHSLSPQLNLTGPTYPVLAQVNQSDLAFLRERARAIDAELWVDDSTLLARQHTGRNGGRMTLTYLSELREFTVLADLAGQRTSVTANGWDVGGKTAFTHEATDSLLGSELGSDQSGASLLQSAFGTRKETLAHGVPLNSQEVQSQAETYFKLMARRFLVGHGVAGTDNRLRAGASLDLQGLGPLFSGQYYATEIQHLFDRAHGLRTEFTVERAGLGRP